jgi:single-strand DNA-binding protein
MSINKFIGIGNVTREPESRFLPDGSPVVNLAIACNEKYKDKSGESKELTEYINIVFFGKLAEIVEKYVEKGNKIYVEGKIKTDKYTDKNGVEKYSTKVVASQMELLGGKKDSLKSKPDDDPFNAFVPKSVGGLAEMDDDIPF